MCTTSSTIGSFVGTQRGAVAAGVLVDCSQVLSKDLLRLPKTLMFTSTSGSGVRSHLSFLPKFHLVECSPWSHLKAWDERKTEFVIYMPKCGARKTISYTEHRAQADEVLQNEIAKGYVQWATNRQEIENDVGTLELAKIAVVVEGAKVRHIHDMRRNGTNPKVTFEERIVLPRVRDIIEGVMELLEHKNNNEGVEFLTLDFWDAFKQLHVVASERRFLAGAAMGGFFSYRTVLFGVGSGPLVWCRVAAWVMRSTQAWLTHDRAHTNCCVDDPIIPVRDIPSQRRKLAMGVLLWWSSLGLKLAYEQGSYGSKVVWIGTQFDVNSRVNKIEVRLPEKKNVELLEAVSNLMDSPGGMARHSDVRRLAGKVSWVASFLPQLKPFARQLWASMYKSSSGDKVDWVYKRQVWPALTWLRMFHGHHPVLVRHLFLVDRLLDGAVLEVDASTTGGGAACCDRQRSQHSPPDCFVSTVWTEEDERLLHVKRGDPAHQATWEAFMALLAIRHFVSPSLRGRIILVGYALGVWYSMIRLAARSPKINEIAKELSLLLAPMGHELVGIHVWSEMNMVSDALSRVGERGSLPPELHHSRRELLSPRGPSMWTCLKSLRDEL